MSVRDALGDELLGERPARRGFSGRHQRFARRAAGRALRRPRRPRTATATTSSPTPSARGVAGVVVHARISRVPEGVWVFLVETRGTPSASWPASGAPASHLAVVDHRQRRQDDDEGADGRAPRPALQRPQEPVELQRRGRPVDDALSARPRRTSAPCSRSAWIDLGEIRAPLRDRAPGDCGRPQRRANPSRTPRQHGGDRRKPKPRPSRLCRPTATAILNADDPYVAAMASKTQGARPDLRHREAGATVRATDDLEPRPCAASTSHLPGRAQLTAHSPLPGERLVSNALAAIAVAHRRGHEPRRGRARPRRRPTCRRVCRRRAAPAAPPILDDSYNASPASMLAALGVLAETPGRRLALLGDMLELGSAEAEGHRAVGEQAAAGRRRSCSRSGRAAVMIADAARARRRAPHVRHFDSKDEAIAELQAAPGPGDVCSSRHRTASP